MRHRTALATPLATLGLFLGCSAGGGSGHLLVGADGTGGGGAEGPGGAGGALVLPPDASVSRLLTAHVERPRGMTVTFVTLSCDDRCADVVAVATGGVPPYGYVWEDGSTNPERTVCPSSTTEFVVTVRDTGARTPEFTFPPQTATASLTASVVECPDPGSPDAGAIPHHDAGAPTQVVVPGTADLWLAAQPDGARLADVQGGADVAPAASPVMVSVTPGQTLSFAVTGTTSNAGGICVAPSADGGCFVQLPVGAGSTNGIGGLTAPLNALVGVFLGPGAPAGPVPPSLDAANTSSLPALAPLLLQPFFIGDGLTGTGTGTLQRFTVPPGATRLFLGSLDGVGSNYNNAGQFGVTVTPVP